MIAPQRTVANGDGVNNHHIIDIRQRHQITHVGQAVVDFISQFPLFFEIAVDRLWESVAETSTHLMFTYSATMAHFFPVNSTMLQSELHLALIWSKTSEFFRFFASLWSNLQYKGAISTR